MTSYSNYLGTLVTEPSERAEKRGNLLSTKLLEPIYELERLGCPTNAIKWDLHDTDLQDCIKSCIDKGFKHNVKKSWNHELRVHLLYFRAALIAYDELVSDKVFSTEELYYRCLTEGPSYATYIKKCRAFSLQHKICLGNNNIPDEYIHEEYSGYDSILHERYLINWDESEDVLDWPYALIEDKSIVTAEVRRGWTRLRSQYDLKGPKGDFIFFTEPVAGKKSMTIDGQKTTDLKNVWTNHLGKLGDGWLAVRKVIPIEAGNVRDTGVPDVETLLKLKLLHKHIQSVTEKLPYSANCSHRLLNRRLARLRSKDLHIHIDFKKAGLTFPRASTNYIIGDLSPGLEITNFVLRTEEGDIRTTRGGVLGWFDQAFSLVSISLLTDLACRQGWEDFDMLQFNDDIEIGFDEMEVEELEYRKSLIIDTLTNNGFILSHRKCFSSIESIFLEDYDKFYDMDMSKYQLAITHYQTALTSKYNWEIKASFANGANFGYTTYLKDLVQGTTAQRFENEYGDPIELGGWKFLGSNDLNTALEEATPNQWNFFMAMKKYKEPHLTTKYVEVNLEKMLLRRKYVIQEACNPVELHASSISLDDKYMIPESEYAEMEIKYAVKHVFHPLIDEEEDAPLLPRRPVPPDKGAGYSYDLSE